MLRLLEQKDKNQFDTLVFSITSTTTITMYIKSIVLSTIFALGLVALVSAQLPFNDFGDDAIPPKEWLFYRYSVYGLREGDMLIADISDTTNTDVLVYAQFDRDPTTEDFWTFAYYQNISNDAFERVFGRSYNFR